MPGVASRAMVILVLAAGCGASQGPSTTTPGEPPPAAAVEIVTDGVFRSVLPAGYVRQDLLPGAVALVRTERSPTPDSHLGSIVIVPVQYDSPDQRADATDLAVCRGQAEQFAQQLRDHHGVLAEPDRQEVRELPSGRVCQFEARVSGATVRPHRAVLTLLQSAVSDYTVTCTMASGDDVAASGCDAFVQSWSWADPI